ncbi:hypothetical protein [Methylobacterium frigidaeris]|uniref:Uncharacterized protein n=1 Tax=Methylobacterium frigidaeris TaxID=2038277 RepID=A0AA37H595_9HYPH|nr:hypothetical protein [Methylobacterium frigidaeris]PIK70582.1 hypothetical protein CS379_23915 [Methylobacterium frigidaeris]GJD59926.1 hypothetical protein MPEAHAMD_0057 [Methylobacterium frigidaeris]
MFFTMTAAIGGAMTAGIWLSQDGAAAAGLAALTVGLMSAAAAASLMIRLDRRTRATDPAIEAEPVADERPRLPRRRVAGSCPPHRRRRPGQPRTARLASAL